MKRLQFERLSSIYHPDSFPGGPPNVGEDRGYISNISHRITTPKISRPESSLGEDRCESDLSI